MPTCRRERVRRSPTTTRRGVVVLFGGGSDTEGDGALADTWLWDGHGWSKATPRVAPPARTGAVMSYDPVAKQIVLYGGVTRGEGPQPVTLDDTWTWDGVAWTHRHPVHEPRWSEGMAMGYDAATRSILLLTLPSSLDVRTGLVGSVGLGTWRWDGNDWQELSTPEHPEFTVEPAGFPHTYRLAPLAHGAGLLFYSWVQPIVHCGPLTPQQPVCGTPDPNGVRSTHTWTWDGSHWTEQHPAAAPVAGRLVVTPGPGVAPAVFTPDGAAWGWDGSDWNRTSLREGPGDGVGSAVYDTHDGDVVAYVERRAPTGESTPEFETWTWNRGWRKRTGSPASATPTTTTTAADPLPAGSVMLGVSGRTISALDDHGRNLRTLVTVFAGRTAENAQLMPDHRTIWYATKADDNQSCPEIVQLDLQTNARTVVAHASDFSLTPDGTKLLLVWPASTIAVTNNCRPVPYSPGVQIYDGAFVVRELASGAQSTLAENDYPTAGSGGPTGHVWISPTGDRLIDATCVVDGCGTHTWTVPPNLSGPIVRGTTDGPRCGCATLVSGANAVYGVDDGSYNHRVNVLRRYEPTNLIGSGAAVYSASGAGLWSVAPTTAGVFVTGLPAGSKVAGSWSGVPPFPPPPVLTLYRVDNGRLTAVGSTTVDQIFPIPPFVAG